MAVLTSQKEVALQQRTPAEADMWDALLSQLASTPIAALPVLDPGPGPLAMLRAQVREAYPDTKLWEDTDPSPEKTSRLNRVILQQCVKCSVRQVKSGKTPYTREW